MVIDGLSHARNTAAQAAAAAALFVVYASASTRPLHLLMCISRIGTALRCTCFGMGRDFGGRRGI